MQGELAVSKGPMEGMVIVNGRPQMERADMTVWTFESIQALQNYSAKN